MPSQSSRGVDQCLEYFRVSLQKRAAVGFLLCFRSMPGTGHVDRVLDVLVDKFPAGAVESMGIFVAVDDVDAFSSVLADQCT